MSEQIDVYETVETDEEYYNSKSNIYNNPYNIDFSKLNNFINDNTEIYIAPEKHRRTDISILIPKGMNIFGFDKFYVYELFNIDTGEVIYYGETSNPYRRYVRHLNDIKNRYSANSILSKVILSIAGIYQFCGSILKTPTEFITYLRGIILFLTEKL